MLSTNKKEMSQSFAHDISTPLLIADINAKSLKQYLPILLEVYREALKRDDDIPEIPLRVQRRLNDSVDTLETNVDKIRLMVTTFITQLTDQPQYLATDQIHLGMSQTIEPECNAVQQRDKVKVLLVDDEVINQQVIGDMLEILGCQVDLTDNGQAAVKQWQNNIYDLILMDCRLPKLDGYQATQAIREEEPNRTPIIALTANFAEDEHESCLQAGMDAIMTKPIKLEQLKTLLERFVTLP